MSAVGAWWVVVDGAVVWVEDAHRRGWIVGKVLCWANRPVDEVAVAVLADPVHLVSAASAVGAFKRAYAGVWRIWGKIDIAALTIGLQVKHCHSGAPLLERLKVGVSNGGGPSRCLVDRPDVSALGERDSCFER